ncbi:holo-[acyl-carrier-protein] synthase [Synchytrium endobioticum]|uniref:Holo-[acyl-carrier-protein] synthase n=1 Tax=Synchytrium endobioticum TaxID=286115 RepID=A0A507CFI1_9FUNG|nr:holo-[acyl-carrier-protein] synthase [Synchytrium endobioticum]
MLRLLRTHSPHRLANRISSTQEWREFGKNFPSFASSKHQVLSNGWKWATLNARHDAWPLEERHLVRWLSVRWVAKEAVFKAIYPHRRMQWSDVSIVKHSGKPQIEFSPHVIMDLPIERAHLSISHDGDYIVAFVTVCCT